MSEQRKCPRTPLKCRIKIYHSSIGEVIVSTRNISDSGVFIITEGVDMPPLGSIVQGQVQGLMAEAPVVDMEIVRVEPGGLGLKFV